MFSSQRAGRRPALISFLVLILLTLLPVTVFAHPGGMAVDGCHRDAAADGASHWHFHGTATSAGPCLERDGVRVRVNDADDGLMAAAVDRIDALEAEVDESEALLAAALDEIELLKSEVTSRREATVYTEARLSEAVARLSEADRTIAAMDTANDQANREIRDLKDTMEAAWGGDPPMSPRCRSEIEGILRGETGWFSDSVSIGLEQRRDIQRACMPLG